MKSTGMIRKLDDLGRIVLPSELRKNLGLENQDELEIFIEGECIILQKFAPSCVFCGCGENLVRYYDKNLCETCISAIRKY